jgi:SpoVK/Ycf46/Vps4 family AAA+-type ATPase
VLAATNRPYALDDAVLRRFSVQYEVPRPDAEQREKILALILRRHVREGGGGGVEAGLAGEAVGGGGPTLRAVAKRARGFAGSDLFELCSQAAAVPVHEYMAALDEAAYSDAAPLANGNGNGSGGAAQPSPAPARSPPATLRTSWKPCAQQPSMPRPTGRAGVEWPAGWRGRRRRRRRLGGRAGGVASPRRAPPPLPPPPRSAPPPPRRRWPA